MTKWHTQVVHMAKHMNTVGSPSLVGAPGPAPNPPNIRCCLYLCF